MKFENIFLHFFFGNLIPENGLGAVVELQSEANGFDAGVGFEAEEFGVVDCLGGLEAGDGAELGVDFEEVLSPVDELARENGF